MQKLFVGMRESKRQVEATLIGIIFGGDMSGLVQTTFICVECRELQA